LYRVKLSVRSESGDKNFPIERSVAMSRTFDPGYFAEPFRTLCMNYPESDVYVPDQFRVEWGPIFHRGRLDGSARVLVIGQDPAPQGWTQRSNVKGFSVAYTPVIPPTEPERSSKNDKQKLDEATKTLLENWNSGLQVLSPSVKDPGVSTALVPYGDTWGPGDR